MKKLAILVLGLLAMTGCSSGDVENSPLCRPAPDIFTLESTPGAASIEVILETGSGTWSVAPSFAVWASYNDGTTESIYVTCKAARNSWEGGSSSSETLPVWYGVRTFENLMTNDAALDAITTATPTRSAFVIHWEPNPTLSQDTTTLFFEANLPNDYNDFYTQNQGSNGQPSLIWSVSFKLSGDSLIMVDKANLIGHSHPKGIDNLIYSDRNGITTAMGIFTSIRINKLKH